MNNDSTHVDPIIRVARSQDVGALLDHLHDSPYAFGPSLPRAATETLLAKLIESHAIIVTYLENRRSAHEHGSSEVLVLAITGFIVPDIAAAWLEEPPSSMLPDELLRLESLGDVALLRPAEVARRNAEGRGLDLAFLAYASPTPRSPNDDIGSLIKLSHDMFKIFHAGFCCRRAFHPASGKPEALASLLAMGFRHARNGSKLLIHHMDGLDTVPLHPFVVLRHDNPATFDFSPSEQALLLHALLGLTDFETAEQLGVSEETIRKRWRRIFQRVANSPSQRIFAVDDDPSHVGRGPEKRGKLLHYIATHLEELRPHA